MCILTLLLIHEAVVPFAVFAEEVTTVPTEQPSTSETTIDTGEAAAVVVAENVVNESQATTPINTDGCVTTGGCPGTTTLENTADLGTSNSATALSGENDSAGTGTTVTITTGDATSNDSNLNKVNNTTTSIETGVSMPATHNSVTNTNNEANVSANNSSSADTGNNEVITNNSDTKITTGEAVAYANVINLVNTNFSGSNIGIYFYNDLANGGGNVDLNQVWKSILDNGGSGLSTIQKGPVESGTNLVIISNHNVATVDNRVSVLANSGTNSATGEKSNGLILTGDATALANVINVINANIVGANFFIGVINLSANNLGDIVLPHPETSPSQNNCNDCNSVLTQSNNQAQVSTTVNTVAKTGNNQTTTTADSSINTGEAVAISNQNTLANIDVRSSGQMMVMMNILGSSSGKIYNWQYPGSVEEWTDAQKLFVMTQYFGGQTLNGENLAYLVNDNKVAFDNQVSAIANSGGNSVNGFDTADIKTGRATAIANVTNLLNLNILGRNWFYGVINIVGNWNGNTVFAYPDVTVEISSKNREVEVGSEIEYQIRYSNLGYDTARGVGIELLFPEGIEYLSDNSGMSVEKSGSKVIWKLEKIDNNFSQYFTVKAKVLTKQTTTKRHWWQLVEPAYASENIIKKDVETKVSINTTDIEVDKANNASSIRITTMTIVKTNDEYKIGEKSNRLPDIALSGENNVNNYVYPGDIVTFDFEIKNKGEGVAKEAVLIHEIIDESGKVWRQDQIFLGDLDRGMEGKLGFGVVMNIEDGGASTLTKKFVSKSKITSRTEAGGDYTSSTVDTTYGVRFLGTKQKVVMAVEKSVGEVLGDSVAPVCKPDDNVIPYLLVFTISGLWLYGKSSYWIRALRKR